MTNGAKGFFDELGRRGHEPLLAKVTGTVRFEVVDGARTDRWLITINRGDMAVSHKRGAADCTIRGESALFDDLAGGRTNAMAAVLRGALVVTGDVELLLAIQRLFPGPARESQSNQAGRTSR